ncbi:MAG TPA: hypothetical protein PLW77_02585 [Bacteroidales bacterium]|nr:hypothetical protein [Bacteroidales bacterium]HQB20745.1 hypothetical protein [Bacteroidales bacterium]
MLEKIIKIFGYTLLVLVALFTLHFFIFDLGSLETQIAETADLPTDLKAFKMQEIGIGWGATILYFAIVLFGLAALFLVGSLLWQVVRVIIDDRSKAPVILITLAVIVGVILLSYFALASSEIPFFLGSDKMEITGKTCKLIDTGLYVLYITLGLTIFAAIYSEIAKLWK